MASRSSIEAFLAQPALAIAGVSRSGKKFGNLACRELQQHGYRVYPIHPAATEIEGQRCYRRFEDLPEPVDAVLVIVPPDEALEVIRDASAAGVHHVWLQQGAESDAVIAACAELGLEVVAGECVLMFANPRGVHKAHRWLWRILGKLPT